jgi:hypothetical protein
MPCTDLKDADVDAETMRRNADNCLALATAAKDEPSRLRYSRMAAAWQALAKNKDWLDGALMDRGASFNGDRGGQTASLTRKPQ